jgi:hypothetical protein
MTTDDEMDLAGAIADRLESLDWQQKKLAIEWHRAFAEETGIELSFTAKMIRAARTRRPPEPAYAPRMSRMSGTLSVVQAQGTQRYALLGRVVSGGSVLELCCSGGWLTGRFEQDADKAPTFYFSIELEGGRVSQQAIELPEGALLRWPE